MPPHSLPIGQSLGWHRPWRRARLIRNWCVRLWGQAQLLELLENRHHH